MDTSTFQQVAKEIRLIRRERGRRAHLPEPLRMSVAQLAIERDNAAAISRDLNITRKAVASWVKRYGAFPRAKRGKAAVTASKVVGKAATAAAKAAATPTSKASARARPEPVAFFEIKTSAAHSTRAPEVASTALELARPDGMTLRLSGELARELAASMLDRFTTTGGTR